jgi:hypothetical protein
MKPVPILIRIQLFAMVTLALPLHTEACTCAIQPLAERYETASVVFVAKVSKRHNNYDASGAGTTEWSFEIVEVLKGDVTFDRLVSDGCGGRVVEGQEYLIFTGNEGRVGTCASGQLNRNERYRADLEVLRNYRTGDLQTIAEPWVFTKWGGMCTLSLDMAVGNGSVIFDYRFADAGTLDFRDQQFQYDINERRTVKLDGVGPHPAYFAGFRRLRIWYPLSRYKVEGTGRLTIGEKKWPTERQNMEAPIGPFEVVTDSAFSEVLEAVKSHESVHLVAEYMDFPYNLKDYPDFPVIKAATPHFYQGTAVPEFQECINRAGQ